MLVCGLATGLRRSAHEEQNLFHYNGQGVPRPTFNNEIWVFNRSYTQYIPPSYDLQSWMDSPSIYVYDCSNTDLISESFKTFADQYKREYLEQLRNASAQPCGGGADVPMAPPSLSPKQHPTHPLIQDLRRFMLRWFLIQNSGELAPAINLGHHEKIPGQFVDRRTMLGELN